MRFNTIFDHLLVAYFFGPPVYIKVGLVITFHSLC